jgi:hypothetical protein
MIMRHEQVLSKLLQAKIAGAPGKALSFGGFGGTWKNQYGSTANFTVTGSTVTGTYTTAVSGGGAPLSGPIVGHVADDIICFSVLWPLQQSITTWAGQVVDEQGTETLKTLWHLVINIDDASEPTGLWTTTLAGADVFTR